MFTIIRKDSQIEIKVETSIGYNYTPTINCGNEPYAILLAEHLREKMAKSIQSIREEAYNQGWNDKTKRKPRETWFRRTW